MHTTEAFTGLRCLDCETLSSPDVTHRCPDCNGPLTPFYDEDALADAHAHLFEVDESNRTQDSNRIQTGLERFAPVRPFSEHRLPSLAEGSTPLVDSPTLAEACGLERVLLKDEGRNATGGIVDRELVLAVAAAREHGAETVALPTTGNAGQAAAAYASRAGLALEAFVPSRSTFDTKAMINVHGGEMTVVGGRYPDALAAFESERQKNEGGGEGWYSLAPFETPYRHEGTKTIAYELFAAFEHLPDALVVPTGHGTELVGIHRGFEELAATDTIDSPPRLYAAQPDGCAPVVDAWQADAADVEPVEYPDTICGALEIPDPAGGAYVLDALDATDGGAVAPSDDEALDAALELAAAGVPISATGGVGIAGLTALAERNVFDSDETVVVVDPATANRETDLLRSRLMSKGV